MTVADPAAPPRSPEALVGDLERNFRAQVKRALSVELDGSATSLAFVDHYLSLARGETRAPILDLLAAGAGVYFGELVRREFGGGWVGPPDARALRLWLGAQFLHFSPVSLAYAAIRGGEPDDPSLDLALHLDDRPHEDPDQPDDAAWMAERLSAAPPLPEDQFFSLTGRFETIALIVELLVARAAQRGSDPRTYTLADYSHVLP